MDPGEIEQLFPDLPATGYRIQSPVDFHYNCIAWAAGDTKQWWWPADPKTGAHWPAGLPLEHTLSAFLQAFATLGFIPSESADLEPGFEKIAIFAQADFPTHAARQLPSGLWTSKLGKEQDIEHVFDALAGSEIYGSVVRVLKRPLTG